MKITTIYQVDFFPIFQGICNDRKRVKENRRADWGLIHFTGIGEMIK
jgi:hypothetical protein